uniref:Engulfment and cell motility 1 (ced-12 homolog, C. elegans) n=1 Tax=Neogobius melanostomus TaxID=47308 RepID=A0A8C6T531_9GOBI
MPPPADIVKVAIEWPGAFPKLMEIDQVLYTVVFGNHENFALQIADTTNFYITEKNRNDIKNGSILRLTTSPYLTASQLHERIQSSSMDAKLEALKDLANASRDITFAQEFINLDGISLLTQMVESGTERYQKLQKIMKPCFGDLLSFTLTAFVELMDHGIVSWDTFSVAFIKKIASYANKSAMDTAVLQRSLAILESMVLNSQDLYHKVAQEITIGQLIPHLQGTDQDIQTYTIAVINALFLKAPEEKRQVSQLYVSIPILRFNSPLGWLMAHQLYVLQVLTFNLLEDRMMTKMDPQDQAQRDIIFELRRIAFDVECEPNSGSMEKRKSMYTRDYKKLGFINHVNPAVDFTQIPPGMLALDNMLYFARHHQDAYIRIVLENSSREDKHECPFGRSSIELTKMLCEILKVGELPSENLRTSTREQIMRALTVKPNSLDQFKSRLQNLSYTEILKIRQSERMNQEDFQSRPILELREKIQPEIMELIKQQRLNRLCEGTCFRKISSRRRQDKFWYCRLSPNHKGEVPHDSLQDKLPVADIKAVITGKDCPHMKEKGALKQNKEVLELAFSVLYESDEYLNFIAPDKHEYCVWTDGLNALLGKEMASDYTKSDMETLLSMEMKLRLLDLENIQIPEAPPQFPKNLQYYNLVYHL